MSNNNRKLYDRTKRILQLIGCLLGLFSLTLSSARPVRVLADSETPDQKKIFFPQVGQGSYFPTSISADWLIHLNYYRSMADLPPLMENLEWSDGDRLHARYMVKNDQVVHSEVAGNPWYTVEGHSAAGASNLVGSGNASADDLFAIDAWMQAPFHAVGVLDPELIQIGFGSYRELDGVVQMGAALDVLRGLSEMPTSVRFPVLWPSSGAVVPLTSYSSEHPNPLTSCPGYSSPSGLPIIVQLGPGHLAPQVSASSFSNGSVQLEHCVFSEVNYRNPNSSEQDMGRSILSERDAVILIPRQPLSPGSRYTASITVDGQTYTWSFEVAAGAKTFSQAGE